MATSGKKHGQSPLPSSGLPPATAPLSAGSLPGSGLRTAVCHLPRPRPLATPWALRSETSGLAPPPPVSASHQQGQHLLHPAVRLWLTVKPLTKDNPQQAYTEKSFCVQDGPSLQISTIYIFIYRSYCT